MLHALTREDVPEGLVFSLGYVIEPGARLVFLRSSDARDAVAARGDFITQSRASLRYLLDLAGHIDPEARIVKVRRHMTSSRGHRTTEVRDLWNDAFGGRLPASTALEVAGSPLLGSVIDLEAWAVAPAREGAQPLVRSFGARLTPDAVTVRGDQTVAIAAVQPDAATSFEAELRSCLSKLEAEFASYGGRPEDVASLTVFFRDPRQWDAIRSMVYGRYGDDCPVVNPVIATNLQRQGGQVEVTGFGLVERSGHTTSSATFDLNHGLLATTGTGAIDIFSGGRAEDMYGKRPPGTIEEQAHLGLQNQQKVLEAAGASLDDVIQTTWYVTDMREWEAIAPIARSYFERDLPVPMVVEVPRLTAKQGVRFEPDFWAAIER